MEHTKGPWRRGMLLDTPQTRKWPEPMKASVNADEKRRIFSNFNDADGGKGRVEICAMQENNPDWEANARLIAAAPEMYEALKEARYTLIKRGLQESTTYGIIEAAIAKAESKLV